MPSAVFANSLVKGALKKTASNLILNESFVCLLRNGVRIINTQQ